MEVIDLRSARPMDQETILRSVEKTGRLIVTDIAPMSGGISAEICAMVSERGFSALKKPPIRIALTESPTPCSQALESAYYPTKEQIIAAARKTCQSPIGPKR